MKSFTACLFASVVVVTTSNSIFAQNVIRAISLGDPIPAFQPDPNLIRVSNSSCNGVTLGFQACCEPAKGCGDCKDPIVNVPCAGNCKAAPSCACAVKAAPCKVCDIVKLFHRAPSACPCAQGKPMAAVPVVCAPVSCAPIHAKAVGQVDKSVACTSCNPLKAYGQKVEYPRPILTAVKSLFNGIGRQTAPAKTEYAATYVAGSAGAISPVTLSAPIPTFPMEAPTVLPQTSPVESPIQYTTPVPAALAPYTSQAPFSTAVPSAGANLVPR